MRTARETTRFAEDMNRQHAWTVQKNSRKDVMADQKTAKTEVKKTELESPHQKIRKIAKRPLKPDSEDCCEGNRDCESVDR